MRRSIDASPQALDLLDVLEEVDEEEDDDDEEDDEDELEGEEDDDDDGLLTGPPTHDDSESPSASLAPPVLTRSATETDAQAILQRQKLFQRQSVQHSSDPSASSASTVSSDDIQVHQPQPPVTHQSLPEPLSRKSKRRSTSPPSSFLTRAAAEAVSAEEDEGHNLHQLDQDLKPPIPPSPPFQRAKSYLHGFSFRSGGNLDDNILRQSALLRRSSAGIKGNQTKEAPSFRHSVSGHHTRRQQQQQLKQQSSLRHSTGASSSSPITKKGGISASFRRTHGLRVSQKSSFRSTKNAHTGFHTTSKKSPHTYERHRVGDSVLVVVNNTSGLPLVLVNRHGYPTSAGVTSDEQMGPYMFVLATVKKVHFEENAEYYTVTRADTGADQRADADCMEKIKTARGEAAAHRAAKETQSNLLSVRSSMGYRNSLSSNAHSAPHNGGPLHNYHHYHHLYNHHHHHHHGVNNSTTSGTQPPNAQQDAPRTLASSIADACLCCFEVCFCLPLVPFVWLWDCFQQTVGQRIYHGGVMVLGGLRKQGKLFLNGMKPYSISFKLTAVNFLVLCSTWFLFIDPARLAFFPPSADFALAIVSFIVWCFLVLELLFEVFIRPKGYNSLIVSEKAYSPSTVRYINFFHLIIEVLNLAIFIPEFLCLLTSNQALPVDTKATSSSHSCSDRPYFSYLNATFMAVLGPFRSDALFGRTYLGLVRLRVFGLVRHWRKMWINNTFVSMRWKSANGGLVSGFVSPLTPSADAINTKQYNIDEKQRKEHALINASNIGTALMVTNSHRALMILCGIMGLFPLLSTINTFGGTNRVTEDMTRQLQEINLSFRNATDEQECAFFRESLEDWVYGVVGANQKPKSGLLLTSGSISSFLLFLSVEPVRCIDDDLFDGVVTSWICRANAVNGTSLNGTFAANVTFSPSAPVAKLQDWCQVWLGTNTSTTLEDLANSTRIRTGAINIKKEESNAMFVDTNNNFVNATFRVKAKYNQTYTVEPAALASFLLQVCLLICVLGDLSVLRRDAGVLVLGPLRRMLKIVARYSKNPLSSATKLGGKDDDDSDDDGSEHGSSPEDKLGNYETEQLINAVSKITDLLRKCWGVAGADIISTNLATQEGTLTEVFNPTVPGKSVYALFGFAAINGFDHTLRQLGGEVMILINDVAAVLHGEVFRWGLGDSGQCNKNLGAAFLMVFRIGLVKEVIQKLEQATHVVFSNVESKKTGVRRRNRNAKKNTVGNSFSKLAITRSVMNERRRKNQRTNSSRAAMSLSLQSLPGISDFTDRAVIGMLKSFAGIYRDNKLLNWKHDFRLGAGVGAFSVSMIFGMDAGWAVEGAVGSEYKIDATYLSPHVNMASRMMSACKQYGVSILLSQAVQELMSSMAKKKLRHLDTVTVKGSSLKQRIYTYDARHKGVDFFLFSRSDEQADLDSDRYTPNIWNTDQDLRAMRQHVTEDFEHEFNKGRDAYLAGDWPKARKHLETANGIMIENVMDQGYMQELNELQNRGDPRLAGEEIKNETGDGPSRRLIAFMDSEGPNAPESWKGYRPLTSK